MVAPTKVADARASRTHSLCRCRSAGYSAVGYASGHDGLKALRARGLSESDIPNPGCSAPMVFVCNHCSGARLFGCATSRASQCPECSEKYKRRLYRIVESGISGRLGVGHMYFLTLTAPGVSRHYRHGRQCPCTPVGGVDLSEWNVRAGECWNRLRTWLKDTYGFEIQYFRGVEIQQRGAIHYHVPVWSPVPIDVDSVELAAVRAGFGHEVDLEPVSGLSSGVPGYVAKYVTKTSDQRDSVPWSVDQVDVETGEICRRQVRATYRGYSKSARWGLTMKEIKAALRDQARARLAAEDVESHAASVLLGAIGFECLAVIDDP